VDIVSAEKEHDYSVIFWNLGYGHFHPSAITLLPGTHEATRSLSVQIFGNVYDRSDSVGFLSPPIPLPYTADLYGVEVFGETGGMRLYVRGRGRGTTTPWILLSPGAIREYPILGGVDTLQYRITVPLSEGSRFHLDSIRAHLGPTTGLWSVKCVPFHRGIALYSSKKAHFSMYNLSGRSVRKGEVLGSTEISGLTAGTYIVIVRTDGKIRRFKVVVR
jgi:hypothetical protein